MKKKLPKWIWQQTNEVALGKTKVAKTHDKTWICKGSNKIVNKTIHKVWKLKLNTLFLLWKKKDKKPTMLYLYGTKDLI